MKVSRSFAYFSSSFAAVVCSSLIVHVDNCRNFRKAVAFQNSVIMMLSYIPTTNQRQTNGFGHLLQMSVESALKSRTDSALLSNLRYHRPWCTHTHTQRYRDRTCIRYRPRVVKHTGCAYRRGNHLHAIVNWSYINRVVTKFTH